MMSACFLLPTLLLAGPWFLGADPPPPPPRSGGERAEIARLISELDADSYLVRREALARLEQIAEQPEASRPLREEIRRRLGSPDTSFEQRHQLSRIESRLPGETPAAAPEPPRPGEIGRLVRQLEADSYATRVGASQRLRAILQHSTAADAVLAALREQYSRQAPSLDARQWLDPLWQRAWGQWLTSDPSGWAPSRVTEGQIARWIEHLARPSPGEPPSRVWLRHEDAERNLREALARDEHVEDIRAELEARLQEGDLDPEGGRRLQELASLCRPAMVAEFWQERQHRGIQHLIVGVPSQAPSAPRPSHFDRIDDRTAHCVSGSNLAAGDYPVGVAIPHPNQPDAVFHLVNLPTPRRRMAYEFLVERSEKDRFAALSRRTVDRFLRLKRPLREREILMLPGLKPEEVSRFAAKHLMAVPDGELDDDPLEPVGLRPSRHGLLCAVLADSGTREAVPGILEAIRRQRVRPPTRHAPYRWDWIAALGIAQRDPWPGVHDWLAGLIEREDPLAVEQESPPELGATAAAILLKLHERSPTAHGLRPLEDPVTAELRITLFRFTSPEARQAVIRWWQDRESVRKASG